MDIKIGGVGRQLYLTIGDIAEVERRLDTGFRKIIQHFAEDFRLSDVVTILHVALERASAREGRGATIEADAVWKAICIEGLSSHVENAYRLLEDGLKELAGGNAIAAPPPENAANLKATGSQSEGLSNSAA